MTRARVLQEVRQMRFEEIYERRQQRSVRCLAGTITLSRMLKREVG